MYKVSNFTPFNDDYWYIITDDLHTALEVFRNTNPYLDGSVSIYDTDTHKKLATKYSKDNFLD